MELKVKVANGHHIKYAEEICTMMADAAKVRGTGIAKRHPSYIQQKMEEGKAVIAIYKNQVAGFCYIESWEGHKYVAHSGLIVHPDFRKTGLAKKIKKSVFELSKKQFPDAKIFGITTSLAVMKINSELGYKPVTFSELTTDDTFWKGCQSCTNYDILQRTNRSMCLCTGMVCEPNVPTPNPTQQQNSWELFKRFIKHKKIRLKRKAKQLALITKTFI